MEEMFNLIQELTVDESRDILNASSVGELPDKAYRYLKKQDGILSQAIRLNQLRDGVQIAVIEKFKNYEL